MSDLNGVVLQCKPVHARAKLLRLVDRFNIGDKVKVSIDSEKRRLHARCICLSYYGTGLTVSTESPPLPLPLPSPSAPPLPAPPYTCTYTHATNRLHSAGHLLDAAFVNIGWNELVPTKVCVRVRACACVGMCAYA